uniref:Uncharacterized protein n=1 Tax=Oryza barthii TaxID=65489 RepID=A0A0D3FLY0_9ORYZ
MTTTSTATTSLMTTAATHQYGGGGSASELNDIYDSTSTCQGQNLRNAQIVVDACEGREQHSKMPSMSQQLHESRVRVEASPADSPTPLVSP